MSVNKKDDDTQDESEPRELRLQALADVKAEPLEWLWEGRIPRGKFTLLDGDPSLGKSTVTADLAARVSTGRELPEDRRACDPAGVLLVCVEDGAADTIRPRVEAAGGDLNKVFTIEPPTLPDDVDRIEGMVNEKGVALVVFDPIVAMMDRPASSDQAVRKALQPLVEMAGRTRAAVVGVRHLNKSSGRNALYRGGGSIGIIGLARSGLLLARDPDDVNQRVLATYKSNLAAHAPSLRFGLVNTPSGIPRIEWKGVSDYNGERLLAAAGDPEKRSALDEATEFLRDLLKDGPVMVSEIKKRGAASGHSWATLRRAQMRLRVEPIKTAFGEGAPWVWTLPAAGPVEPANVKGVVQVSPVGAPQAA